MLFSVSSVSKVCIWKIYVKYLLAILSQLNWELNWEFKTFCHVLFFPMARLRQLLLQGSCPFDNWVFEAKSQLWVSPWELRAPAKTLSNIICRFSCLQNWIIQISRRIEEHGENACARWHGEMVIYEKWLKSIKGWRKPMLKILHSVIVCTCIWGRWCRGNERIKGFSQSTFFPWLFKHYSKQIPAHANIRLVQLRLTWNRRLVHEARFILLESNVLRKSILVHQGKGEGLGNSIPSLTFFFFNSFRIE